jgi:hypothetical protein
MDSQIMDIGLSDDNLSTWLRGSKQSLRSADLNGTEGAEYDGLPEPVRASHLSGPSHAGFRRS